MFWCATLDGRDRNEKQMKRVRNAAVDGWAYTYDLS